MGYDPTITKQAMKAHYADIIEQLLPTGHRRSYAM
jgi:hypothetical protein